MAGGFMSELLDYEARYLAMLDELTNCSEVKILYEERGPIEEMIGDASETFELIADEEGVHLDPTLHRTFLRFEGLSSHWAIERPGLYLTGEFSIRHIGAAMLTVGAELATDDTPEEERRVYSELRVFDEHPRGGGGTLAGLRISPGMSSPEVWYFDGPHGAFKLNLGYDEYLDALLVTKGVYGWQHLYTDVSLGDIDFLAAAEAMEAMLDVFPELFPDHDYAPFHQRLAERRG
ncbi:hypothetical protein E1294_32610 [Nonomuraea diastatica]|uniref:Uncharacterized protein n=2 Tax=Nonomuraea diastatica TaxID=1848329 RepID=A0A4V2YDN4_9ACTN|nr:hypothetical protein E1294_32610 [Nonomuraea diastatica]